LEVNSKQVEENDKDSQNRKVEKDFITIILGFSNSPN
jgi:negative regulator of genetic competence, sporulation and motility